MRADCVEYLAVRKTLFHRTSNSIKELVVLGRLGNNNGLFQAWEPGNIIRVADHMASALGISEEAFDLRMVHVTHDNDSTALPGILGDNGLDLDDPRTGGIDDCKACINKGLLGRRWHTMGSYDNAPAFGHSWVIQDRHTLVGKNL